MAEKDAPRDSGREGRRGDAESFKHQDHLDRILSEAQHRVDSAVAAARRRPARKRVRDECSEAQMETQNGTAAVSHRCRGAVCWPAVRRGPRNATPFEASSGGAVSSNHVEKGSHSAASPEAKEHGLTQEAVDIARVFGLPITNSMVVTWLTAIGLIVFAQIATRHMKPVPDGAQNFCEWLVETLYDFLEGIIGRQLVQRTFWFFASVFIFILAANWVGLIPGSDTVGWGHQTAEGFRIDQPLFRGATADLNMTLAMALVFFACWIVWAFRNSARWVF